MRLHRGQLQVQVTSWSDVTFTCSQLYCMLAPHVHKEATKDTLPCKFEVLVLEYFHFILLNTSCYETFLLHYIYFHLLNMKT